MKSLGDRIRMFEDDSKILAQVAGKYPEDSPEYAAVKHAAIALWYVLVDGHEQFTKYVEQFDGDLSPEQREYLLRMGVIPD